MGTYYRVTYGDSLGRDFGPVFDSLLRDLNLQVSTYIDSSTISRFNRSIGEFTVHPADSHFVANLEAARQVYTRSAGAFDPTVMPLVNYWGFGYTEKRPVTSVDSVRIAELMQAVGMDKVYWSGPDEKVLRKALPGVQLDFSAIAKGYGVDLLGRWLEKKGIGNYLVDIGGELRARGRNARDAYWTIGINVPRENAGIDQIQTTVSLRDMSVATSGNYRNFYEVEGRKYSHTINPHTGFPERSTLLSASLLHEECTLADAYATACMVLGLEKALQLVDSTEGLEGYFIFGDNEGAFQVAYSAGYPVSTDQ